VCAQLVNEISINTVTLNRAKNFGCLAKGKTYWSTTDSCQENSLVAFADYTKIPSDTRLFLKDSYITLVDNKYTLPSYMANNTLYAFGVIATTLLFEDTTDPDVNPILLQHNESTKIETKLIWNINITKATRVEIR
jgi:hypothetical protein